jgi:hypothetical protein
MRSAYSQVSMTKVQALRATTGPRKEVLVMGLNESMIVTKSLAFGRWKMFLKIQLSAARCSTISGLKRWISNTKLLPCPLLGHRERSVRMNSASSALELWGVNSARHSLKLSFQAR